VWPRRTAEKGDEDEDENELESFNNRRLMRLGAFRFACAVSCTSVVCLSRLQGDDFADLVPSDPGSITSDEEGSEETDDYDSVSQNASVTSSITSAPSVPNAATTAVDADDHEFQTEVRLSLDRAFSEGHSLENASVELKTLRMASNVPLRRVREAVVAGIVERITLIEGAVPQRAEIKKWVDRWGDLINLIGGIDGVETVSILQVSFFSVLTQRFRLGANDCPFRSTTAPARHAFTCLVKYSRHFIKMISSRKTTFEIGMLSRKPRAKTSRTGNC
jgi:translation initiation factor eIF-2B subunit epsilon